MKRLINSSMALMTAISLYTTADVFAQSSIAEAVQSLQFEPFTYRAPLDPFKIHQLPDFLMHLRERSDFVIQRSVFAPGVGGWHTHPGPSFAFVIQGHIKLQKFTEKEGCIETPVYGPGQVYMKPANEVHRAIVLGEENEVELIVRFNFPEGGAIGIPAADPGCSSEILVPAAAPLNQLPHTAGTLENFIAQQVDPFTFRSALDPFQIQPLPDFLMQILVPAAAPLNQPPHTADTLESIIAQQVDPFTFRATLDPFHIHQLPDFLMHSRDQTDLVIQRSVFAPGFGPWHIHPGPSFVYVIDGKIKLQKSTEKEGCFETQVYGPGQAYFEVGNQVHRAEVVSEGSVVLMVVRFLPVGAPITIRVPDPGCF